MWIKWNSICCRAYSRTHTFRAVHVENIHAFPEYWSGSWEPVGRCQEGELHDGGAARQCWITQTDLAWDWAHVHSSIQASLQKHSPNVLGLMYIQMYILTDGFGPSFWYVEDVETSAMSRAVAAQQTRIQHPRLRFRNISKPEFYIDHLHQKSLGLLVSYAGSWGQLKMQNQNLWEWGPQSPRLTSLPGDFCAYENFKTFVPEWLKLNNNN